MPVVKKLSNKITSGDGTGYMAKVNAAGYLMVETPTPEPPPGTTPVSVFYFGEHNNTEYTEFEIPAGKRMVFQGFAGGALQSTRGSRMEIRDRGQDDAQWDLICMPIFVNGSSFYKPLNVELEATPTTSRWFELLVINTLKRFSGGEVFGYLEDL